MAAYIIVEVETTDEALMAEYRKHTPGGWTPSRVVVLEFPTYEKAEAFYHGEHYKPILEMRLKAGKSKAILVDGHNG
jgi:uncharacterized protein (DUF1330 family)